MAILAIPFSFSAGAVIIASQHNANNSAIFSDYNGNIEDVNISATAAIQESKLLFSATGHAHTGTTNGKKIALATAVSGTLPTANGGTGSTANANAAGGVVVPTGAVNQASGAVILDASAKLPAVDGSALTGIDTVYPYTAGTYLESSAVTERFSGLTSSYTKVKEFTPLVRGGVISVVFDLAGDSNPANGYRKIYVNDVAVGTERSVANSSYVTQPSENITVLKGDVIQIYTHGAASNRNSSAKNVYIKTARPTFPQEVTGL